MARQQQLGCLRVMPRMQTDVSALEGPQPEVISRREQRLILWDVSCHDREVNQGDETLVWFAAERHPPSFRKRH